MATTLGDRIRGKRNEKRLTQVELARRAGLNPKTVGFIEGGKSGGMYDSISRIASALGVSFDYLEKGEGGVMMQTVKQEPDATQPDWWNAVCPWCEKTTTWDASRRDLVSKCEHLSARLRTGDFLFAASTSSVG